jgi:heptosyltransferase-3
VSTPAAQILVIRGGAIGDFILTLPVLSALRAAFPRTRLETVAYERVAALAEASGLVDGWRPIESRGLASYFARHGVLEPEWQEYFSRFAVIISYLFDPDGIFQANVRRGSKVQFIQGPHRPDEKSLLHATDQLLKPLVRLAIFDADPIPKLVVSPPSTIHPPPSALLALHPGSGSEAKNWPVARWQELLARLVKTTEHHFLLIGGEADQRRLEQVAAVVPAGRGRVLFNRPLTEVATELAQARFLIGHDSGMTHLAAALGLPGVVLWGPTNETVWRPRSERFQVLRDASGLGGLSVDAVLRSLPL